MLQFLLLSLPVKIYMFAEVAFVQASMVVKSFNILVTAVLQHSDMQYSYFHYKRMFEQISGERTNNRHIFKSWKVQYEVHKTCIST